MDIKEYCENSSKNLFGLAKSIENEYKCTPIESLQLATQIERNMIIDANLKGICQSIELLRTKIKNI